MRTIVLFLALFVTLGQPRTELPQISESGFDGLVEKYRENSLVVCFFDEDTPNQYLSFLSTWEMLYNKLNGDLYRFFMINM